MYYFIKSVFVMSIARWLVDILYSTIEPHLSYFGHEKGLFFSTWILCHVTTHGVRLVLDRKLFHLNCFILPISTPMCFLLYIMSNSDYYQRVPYYYILCYYGQLLEKEVFLFRYLFTLFLQRYFFKICNL